MLNKKWILFINPNTYPCVFGGLEVFNFYFLKELSKYYDVHQFTFCKQNSPKSSVVKHIYKRPKFLKISGPLLIFFFLLKNKNKIKLLHLSYSRAYWTHWYIYVIAKKLLGIKYIMTIHGGGLSAWKPFYPYESFFRNAEYITGVSDLIVEEYTKRSNRKIIFTPPLIPFDIIETKNKYRSDWGINGDDLILLYVGSLKPLKSVETLIEALGVIPYKRLTDYKLKVLIVGDGISRKYLEKRVVELKLQGIVNFLGNIERGKINQLYNLADFYTICSEFEGLPISLLEAFANELPCITSDAPGLKEVSENNKNTLLFKVKDQYDFAKKIETLISDDKLQLKLKINGKIFLENNYSYENLILKFKKIITSIK